MESQDLLARFRQSYGEEYADFLTADWGPPPHCCPFCRTETLRKLLIGDPSRKVGESVSAKWYMWCESCLRGIYCPPGTYAVPPGKPYVTKGDEAAIKAALPPGLKLIRPAPNAALGEKRQNLQQAFDSAGGAIPGKSAEQDLGKSGDAPAPSGYPFRAPHVIFWAAFLLRVAYITLGHTYLITAVNHHFEFGWETGRVAASLASGHGYSSPFSGDTGPTAWMTPGFTLLLAGVFKIFGIYTPLSAWVIQAIDSLFQALTVPLVFEVGARTAGRRTALWAAWVWAVYPGVLQYAVRWIWETSLTGLLFAVVLVLALRMRGIGSAPPERQRVRDWGAFGLVWGAIAMTNPALMLMAPVEGLWVLCGAQRREWARSAALAAMSAVLCCAVAAPWVIRNERVFHAFIPTRDNLGAELAMAWAPDSAGFPWGATVPTVEAAPEHRVYARMGELAYVNMRGALAKQWARKYPAHFWKLVALRFYMFWASVPHESGGNATAEVVRETAYCFGSITGVLGLVLALRRRLPAAWLFAWATLLLPAIYYFVIAGARFRNPLEPFFCVLTVYLFQQAEGRWGFSVPGLRRLWPAS